MILIAKKQLFEYNNAQWKLILTFFLEIESLLFSIRNFKFN